MNEANPFEELDTTDYKAEYLNFCEHVRRSMIEIAGALLPETSSRAADARAVALRLCTNAANRKNQTQMQAEVSSGPDRYDLAALAVNADTLTNSETAYERD